MSNWLLCVYRDWLCHVVSHLRQELLKQGHLHIDETHVQVLKEPERKNTSDSYMWVYCSIRDQARPVRYFEYQPGRGGKYPEAFLKGYTGYIHTDAYSGYNGVKGVTRCLCYTHLRRAFVDALPKDIHDPKASKPAEAVLRLNKLFEIEKEREALGLSLSRATMSNRLLCVCRDWLSHVVSHLRQELLKQGHLHIDETHVQVLKEPERKNTSDSYMWVYCSIRDQARPVRYFEYQPGRGGKYPEAFLKGYTGYIHTDAYSGYNGVKGVTRCLCYTHLRRAFVDALPKDIHDPKASKPAEAVLRLNKLFEIEKELEGLPPEQKKKERINREKPLPEAFWSWAELNAAGELPKPKLHTAFRYALNNRQEFFNYLEDGNCSISNSLAENCIRPFVIGRKNWLFAGSPKGAAASAGIYTLVETAKANGLDAMKYIKYILSDMPGSTFLENPEYLDDYLPWDPMVQERCR